VTAPPLITLNSGNSLPQLGFGWDRPGDADTQRAVEIALDAGYRLVDTAAYYRNESGIGKALAASGVARDELYVSTKLWNSDHGRELTLRSFTESLKRLGVDYVDMYLMHWPVASRDLYVETWKTFEELAIQGLVRSIGVSNFEPSHIERLRAECGTVPAVNQIELHPEFQQADLRRYHREHGIVTEAWRPLALARALENPVIERLAEAHERTPAQIVLRWHIQVGNIVIPKSGTPERIRSNFDVFDFILSADDMEAVGALERGGRIGPHPDTFQAITDEEVEAAIAGVDPKRAPLEVK
jgi:2,5-diketo-D-gluconate reductase A